MPIPDWPTDTLTKSTSPSAAHAAPISAQCSGVRPEPSHISSLAHEADADDELDGTRGTHGLEHPGPEPHAVLERPAELVGAVVEQRRQELVDEVPVGGVDLDAVEAGRRAVGGRSGEGRDELVDLVVVERLRRLLVLRDG